MCFVFSFGRVALAEEGSFDLGEVVVTATKTPHFLKDVPGNVTIVTEEEIEESGFGGFYDIYHFRTKYNFQYLQLSQETYPYILN